MLLIKSIRILDGAHNIVELGDEIATYFYGVHKEHREWVYEALLGWWFERVTSHLLERSVNFIEKDEVELRLSTINDKYKNEQLPSVSDTAVNHPDISILKGEQRRFIRQLQIIGVSEKRILKAIYEHDRAAYDRSHWARVKLLFDKDFGQFDNDLHQEWIECFNGIIDRYTLKYRRIIEDIDDNDCQSLGQDVYERTQNVMVKILGKLPESYVCRGSFHMLADKNPALVGWHPRFEELFNNVATEVEK